MAHHNLENQIKEKLNNREIQPSVQSWDRLDAMLTISEEKKPKKGYGWFFVAASMVLFFGLGFFLFNTNKTTEINNSIPVVTTINEEIDSTETNKINQISVEKEQPILVQNEVNYSKTVRNKKSEEAKELTHVNHSDSKDFSDLNHDLSSKTNSYDSSDKLISSNQKVEQVTASEFNITSKSKLKINANFLLTTVAKELDENYRETTLDKVNRMLKDTKSAVANRNFE